MYAGLRRGELLALRWEDIDLAEGVIRVRRSYDPKAGVYLEPKTRAGRRNVPIASVLRGLLIEHRLATGPSDGLVFGTTADRPFTPSNATRRAATAWARANKTRRKLGREPLQPISLHECRHTFASLMIAANVNAKALSTYMGHASVTIRPLRHLMPGKRDRGRRASRGLSRSGDRRRSPEVEVLSAVPARQSRASARQLRAVSSGSERTTPPALDLR
jgi:integrase